MKMMRRLQNDLKRWLAAEAAGDERQAEDAFGTLLASAPRLTPSAGFAERVLWAIQPAPAPQLALGAWWWKAAVVAAVTLVGTATGLLPLVQWLPIGAPSFGEVLRTGADGLVWIGEWLAAGLALWGFLARIGTALQVAVVTPQVASLLLASTLIGVSALYSLNRLLAFERRTW
jgi:hypothetical protein